MLSQLQVFRVALFAALIGTVYWLAARWLLLKWRGKPPRTALGRAFMSRIAGAALLSLAGLGLLCFAYGFLIEPRWLTVKEYRIVSAKLPTGERLRIVHLADLHVRQKGSRERRLPELVRSLNPDLILYTGDFFGQHTDEAAVLELLNSWPVPQFACMGNLDGLGDFHGVLSAAGVTALNAETASVVIRGVPLTVTGFASGREGNMNRFLQGLPKECFNIVLYHHPQGFPETWGTPADLMLAGHTHGGQIRVPFYGALVTLDRFDKRWESGLFDEHGVTLIVGRGIGCEPITPEMRFCCRPEAVVIDLCGLPAE